MKLSDDKVEIVRRHNKVVYHDGDRTVKVFVPTKPAVDVFREALNLARMEQAEGLNTPQVLEVSQVEDGSWALAMKYVPGKTLHEMMDEAKGTPKFDELLKFFVDLQIKVQDTPAPKALTAQGDKLVRMISRVKGMDPSARYDLQMRADRMKRGTAICHGDFNPTNIVVGEGEPFVCDWTHVTVGLPEADAAMTYMLLKLEFPEAADKYLDVYSKSADVPKQKIMYWLPVVAAAELSRGRKGNEEFLKGWIDMANDYE
ncbi:aminoglycoside phosphotransferase family protein [Olsenella sp. AM39-30AC]|uniref:aminoglycoside phosphotransferase family protein n=1 Tax=Olsenella sp. AM39-30AC TaxID=2292360 RepID=UPI000E55036D|nr:aminoglycoside phosphotransferase family protein [Olsenella sp. AM39-30AC]RHB57020.1 aminoglycoside phosphotransferase family protein [Olsenella sp. AM39-30AC]